jgi:hypothetical protein
VGRITLVDCELGVSGGIYNALSGYDIDLESTAQVVSSGLVQTGTIMTNNNANGVARRRGYIASQRHQGVAGSHKMWKRECLLATEGTVVDTGTTSLSMTPNSLAISAQRAETEPFSACVANGNTITPSVRVYKSAAYDGAQPRLVLKANPAAGIASDTVLATMTGGTGAWETLSAATAAVTDDAVLEFFVDCTYGTGGIVYVDTVTCADAENDNFQYWLNGSPFSGVVAGGSGVSGYSRGRVVNA